MKLRLTNNRTFVDTASADEADWLWEYLSFEDSRLSYLQRQRRKKGFAPLKDDRIRVFDRLSRSFPGGFTSMVLKAARDASLAVTVDDHRVKPVALDTSADLSWLRDYQLEGVKRSVRATRGLLWLPTGSGKTEIAVGLAACLPCQWLFIVHRSTLMHQAADRFESRLCDQSGRVGDEQWTEERFTTATFQTLYKALKVGKPEAQRLLDSTEGLIVDEAHTLPADSFLAVVNRVRKAYWRIGMSGTPLARGDRRSVLAVGALGPVIHRVPAEDLIAQGVLAKPQITMVAVPAVSTAATYQGVYGECVVRGTQRNKALVEIAKRAAKPALLFVKQIKHGRVLCERLGKAGISAGFVWGDKQTASRQAAIKRLVRGDLDVLVCSVVFQEGTDIPELRSVIVGSAGRSVIATIQRIGRGMRVAEEKGNTFEVWDIYDKGHKILERHARARRKAYEREGHDVTIEQSVTPSK